jgi:hypothetical protein
MADQRAAGGVAVSSRSLSTVNRDCLEVITAFVPATSLLVLRLVGKMFLGAVEATLIFNNGKRPNWIELDPDRDPLTMQLTHLTIDRSGAPVKTLIVQHFSNGLPACFEDIVVRVLLRHAKYLEEIRIRSCGRIDRWPTVLANCDSFENLRTLALTNCNWVDSGTVIFFARRAPHLAHVDVGCTSFDDTGFVALGEHCHELKTLEAEWASVDEDGIMTVVKGCPELECLEIPMAFIPDSVIANAVRACRRLNRLTIHPNQSAVAAAAAECRSLTHLSIRGSGIDDAMITRIVTNNNNLRRIDLTCAENKATDAALNAIAAHCGGTLRNLHLYGSELGITDAGLQTIAKSCQLLESVSVAFTRRITDAGVIALLTSCPLLCWVDLDGAGEGVTDASLEYVARLPHLATLQARMMSRNVTQAGVQRVKERFPAAVVTFSTRRNA